MAKTRGSQRGGLSPVQDFLMATDFLVSTRIGPWVGPEEVQADPFSDADRQPASRTSSARQ